ncbi:hypothetical protein GC163_08625 [bacterium]|nr:hypothetical protein [bacterium]
MSESVAKPKSKVDDRDKPIFLVSYPKIILLYPTFFAALLAGILTRFIAPESAIADSIGWSFLWLFAFNITVLSFDFPRTTSLTLFFLAMAGVLTLVLLAMNFPTMVPAFLEVVRQIHPEANSAFYFVIAVILGVIYIFVFIMVRFDYWEVRPNELLHHHGFLASLERYSSPNLRITKEIDDVFEYMLLGSGRLVLHPRSEPRAFVLDNVPFISSKEARITKMLGALQVSVREDSSSNGGDDDDEI